MKILKLLVDMPDYNLKAGNLVLSTTMKDDSHYDIWINDKIVSVFIYDVTEVFYEEIVQLLNYYNKL